MNHRREFDFIDGYAWPVRAAHREYVPLGRFDPGSLFHSSIEAYSGCSGEFYSLQVHESAGAASARALNQNLQSECLCSLFAPGGVHLAEKVKTTNQVAIDLLRTGDIETFLDKLGSGDGEDSNP